MGFIGPLLTPLGGRVLSYSRGAISVASARSSRRMQAALKTRYSRQLFAIKKPLLRTPGCALSDKFLTAFFIDINHEDQPTTFT
jgi:hypothetical protein